MIVYLQTCTQTLSDALLSINSINNSSAINNTKFIFNFELIKYYTTQYKLSIWIVISELQAAKCIQT